MRFLDIAIAACSIASGLLWMISAAARGNDVGTAWRRLAVPSYPFTVCRMLRTWRQVSRIADGKSVGAAHRWQPGVEIPDDQSIANAGSLEALRSDMPAAAFAALAAVGFGLSILLR